jgi:hypothetical protein
MRTRRVTVGPDLFVVMGYLFGSPLRITVADSVPAAAAAAWWLGEGALGVDWYLRDDLTYRRPVLLLTGTDQGTTHATVLVPGTPVSELRTASCGADVDLARVWWPGEGTPCGRCVTALHPIQAAKAVGNHCGAGWDPDLARPHSALPVPAGAA